MSHRLRRASGDGPATLLLARVENMHRVADTLAPEDLLRLFTSILDAIEVRVATQGGHFVTWDPSSTEGATAVCAWLDDSQTDRLDIRGIARELTAVIRSRLDRQLGPHMPRTRVVAAVCRGPCLHAREGPRVTMLVGTTLVELYRLARSRPGPGDVVVTDASTADVVG